MEKRKIVFVLSPSKVIRKINGVFECLACQAKGNYVEGKLGIAWERGVQSLFKDKLIHKHWCPVNTHIMERLQLYRDRGGER